MWGSIAISIVSQAFLLTEFSLLRIYYKEIIAYRVPTMGFGLKHIHHFVGLKSCKKKVNIKQYLII